MRITEVADGVFFVRGGAVNWTVLREGGGMTLVDAGYPGDAGQVLDSLKRVGGPAGRLRAVLLTHAHVDHVGGVAAVLAQAPVPVLTGRREAAHARREFLEQAGPADVARNLRLPGMAGWLAHVAAKGGLSRRGAPTAAGVDPGAALDVPGGPVPVLVPGHTSGHTCYLLPAARALVSGDVLGTGHWLSRVDGPQQLPAFFDLDRAQASRSLREVVAGLEADLLLPGHGPHARVSPADAVAQALAR